MPPVALAPHPPRWKDDPQMARIVEMRSAASDQFQAFRLAWPSLLSTRHIGAAERGLHLAPEADGPVIGIVVAVRPRQPLACGDVALELDVVGKSERQIAAL